MLTFLSMKRKSNLLILPILLLLFFTGPLLSAQTKAAEISRWNGFLYDSYTWKNFTDFQPFHEEIDLQSIDYPLLHAAIFFYTNEFRAKNSLPPLKWKLPLETAAYTHSKEMATKNYFSHYSPTSERKSPLERVGLAGVANPMPAENIVQNYALNYKAGRRVVFKGPGKFSYVGSDEILTMHTYLSCARTLVDAWIASPPHKKNMLSTNALEMGTGAFIVINHRFNDIPSIYATQNFQWYKPIIEQEATDPPPPGHIALDNSGEETEEEGETSLPNNPERVF